MSEMLSLISLTGNAFVDVLSHLLSSYVGYVFIFGSVFVLVVWKGLFKFIYK